MVGDEIATVKVSIETKKERDSRMQSKKFRIWPYGDRRLRHGVQVGHRCGKSKNAGGAQPSDGSRGTKIRDRAIRSL